MKETKFEEIARLTEYKPSNCSCSDCALQCRTPCLGTPEDIEKLIDAGYGDKIKHTIWLVGALSGVYPAPIGMFQLEHNRDTGYCVMYENGLCKLHDSGLKPTEGKLSHHSYKTMPETEDKWLTWLVAKEWIDDNNYDVIERVINKLI